MATPVKPVEVPVVPPLLLPAHTDPGSDARHHGYHSLGHSLRVNVFPDVPSPCVSQTRSSYVSPPPTHRAAQRHLWFGHTTDDVVQWTERNFVNQKLKKRLTEMEKKSTAK